MSEEIVKSDFILTASLGLLAGGWVTVFAILIYPKFRKMPQSIQIPLFLVLPVFGWFCVVFVALGCLGTRIPDWLGMRLLATGGNVVIASVIATTLVYVRCPTVTLCWGILVPSVLIELYSHVF